MVKHDLEHDSPELLYLDLLFLFHDMCLDVNFCVEQGALDKGAGRRLQQKLVDAVADFHKTRGPVLRKRVRRDLADVMLDAVAEKGEAWDHIESRAAAFIREMTARFRSLPAETFGIMTERR